MQTLRCVADDDAARSGGAHRLSQGKRIRHAASYFQEPSQAKAEAALYLGEKFLVRPRHGRLRGILRQGQYQRAASAIQGQQRQRTAGCEPFVGHVVVKALRQHRGDHRRLSIVARLRGNAECAAHGRLRPIGSHDELGIDRGRGARLEDLDLDRPVLRGDLRHFGRTKHFQTPAYAKPRPESAAERTIGDYVPQGGQPLLAGVDARKTESPLVRHVDLGDGCRKRVQRGPHADGLQDSAAAVREGRGALVKAGLCRCIMWNGLNERHTQVQRRERHPQGRAHHAAAHDDDIEVHRSDSMASGVFSSAPVSTSGAP